MERPVVMVLRLRGRDWTAYFLAFEETKSRSWKGLQVTHDDDKRKPSKAKQTFVPTSHVARFPNEIGWHKISADELPANVQARFAEAAA